MAATTVYTITRPCGCVILRGVDKLVALEVLAALNRHGAEPMILDAIVCRTDKQLDTALYGPIPRECPHHGETTAPEA